MTVMRARVSAAKVAPPSALAPSVPRPRLYERLEELVDPASPTDIVRITAPAGFGKTTLVSDWAVERGRMGDAIAWCSLDGSDTTAYRLWSAVLSALSAADALLAEQLRDLAPPRTSGNVEFLTEVADALAGNPVVLVLDNLHDVGDKGLVDDLNSFVERRPPGLGLVLSSRSDPPMQALLGAVLTGRVTQLRAGDLAFTPEEVAAAWPDLTAEQQQAIWRRTEGWPAMSHLMGLAVRTTGSLDFHVTEDSALADYLFQEMFRRQSEEVQETLLLSSVPDSLPLDLAVRLTGLADAGSLLEGVARRSGLVTRTWHAHEEEPWYRFHPILRAYLHGELVRRDRDRERRAHREAACWFLERTHRTPALQHAIATHDPVFLDEVVKETGPPLINAGEAEVLATALSSPGLGQDPRLPWTHVMRAGALLDVGLVNEAAAQLQDPGESDPHDRDLRTARRAVDVHLRRRKGLPSTGEVLNDPVVTTTPDLRILLAVQRGSALLWRGDLADAEAELMVGVELARGLDRSAALIDCLTLLASVASARSDFHAMVAPLDEALALAEVHGWTASPRIAYTHSLRAWAYRQSLDISRFRAHAARGVALLDPAADPTIVLSAKALHLAATYEASEGGAPDADRFHAIWDRYDGKEATPSLVAYFSIADAQYSLQLHRTARVQDVLVRIHERLGECGEFLLVGAMLEEANGHPARARDLIRPVVRGEVPTVAPMSTVHAHLVDASLALKMEDPFAAVNALRSALDLADRLQSARPLLGASDRVLALMRAERGRWGRHEELVERVLALASGPVTTGVTLTARELDVLRELPNLRTVDEIADSLFVSINTVKTHLRSVYRKLGVTSRRGAVAEARRTGLL